MSLDKQKILSELGSVMNQLQSADCGCIGNLFGNGNTNIQAQNAGNPSNSEGHRHACCCGHGQNRFHGSCSGDQSCLGRCNPAQLYSDTYQYLNNNLMQPVVKEVYDDLKTITPANTVMNNQLVSQLNTTAQSPNLQFTQGNNNYCTGMNQNAHRGLTTDGGTENGMMGYGTSMGGDYYMLETEGVSGKGHEHVPGGFVRSGGEKMNAIGNMSGMGQNIVNMMMGGKKSESNRIATDGNVATKPTNENMMMQPMLIDAPQSPHGQIGLTPIQNQMGANQYGDKLSHPVNQNIYTNQGYATHPNANKVQVPNGPPASTFAPNYKTHGQHANGIAKFNEMFPGVMKNFGGDLNFDPMAIAVQMNPANHQRAAFDTMQKVMSGNNAGINKRLIPPNNVPSPSSDVPAYEGTTQSNENNTSTLKMYQSLTSQSADINNQQEQLNKPFNNENQHVFAATGQTTLQPHALENVAHLQRQPNQAMDKNAPSKNDIYPNEVSLINNQIPQMNKDTGLPGHITALQTQRLEKETIFPANVSRNQSYSHVKRPENYTYNTLGQPVEMLPARNYHVRDPGGPQTISPQDVPPKLINDPKVYSTVKSTISKTSLTAARPIAGNLSRSQLHHVYNQYKGSQSLTRQNIIGRDERVSHSEGMLNIPQQRAGQNVINEELIVERDGGDTVQGNEDNRNETKGNADSDHIGDVSNVDHRQKITTPDPTASPRFSKARNGLQDIVYTSYPSSAAWSFHGNTRPPLSVGLRNRTRF